ncbi:MAG: hypothetical protein SWH54_17235 [Thermodesulfobacteriota bacterium]|nr:hypothetical protein [Thermodesulfobacteriota bacterium]
MQVKLEDVANGSLAVIAKPVFNRLIAAIYLNPKVFICLADIINGTTFLIHPRGSNDMNTKLLVYSAIIFFIIAIKVKNDLLYFFFSVHFISLAIAVFLYKFDKNSSDKNKITKLP